MKRAVRDSVAQIGNHTSKASIQSGTALNARETENSVTEKLEAGKQREHNKSSRPLNTRTSSRRTLQYHEGEELRTCCNKANRCFSTAMLFKLQDWCSTAVDADDGSGAKSAYPVRARSVTLSCTDKNQLADVLSQLLCWMVLPRLTLAFLHQKGATCP